MLAVPCQIEAEIVYNGDSKLTLQSTSMYNSKTSDYVSEEVDIDICLLIVAAHSWTSHILIDYLSISNIKINN